MEVKRKVRRWFTSDTHFGHKNIRKFCPWSRGMYESVEEMDEAMIAKWNATIAEDDDVYHIGDFAFYWNFDKICEVLSRLNGRIHFIMGNHDEFFLDEVKGKWTGFRDTLIRTGLVYSVQDYCEERFDGQKVCIMHFPLAVWHQNHRGAWNLYGHCHGSFKAVGRQLDVGWDSLDFGTDEPGPRSLERIREVLMSREIIAQDHHDEKEPR